MAIIPLTPIGAPRKQVIDDRTFDEFREALDPLPCRQLAFLVHSIDVLVATSGVQLGTA